MARDQQATRIADDLRKLIGDVAKAAALEVTAELVESCPIDTGNARANFVPHIGGAFPGVDATGQAQTAGQVAVVGYKLGDGPIHITNNVEYLKLLLLGSSSQAPAGWDLAALDRAITAVAAKFPEVTLSRAGNVVTIEDK